MADEITPHNKEILSSCMRFIDFEKKNTRHKFIVSTSRAHSM